VVGVLLKYYLCPSALLAQVGRVLRLQDYDDDKKGLRETKTRQRERTQVRQEREVITDTLTGLPTTCVGYLSYKSVFVIVIGSQTRYRAITR
jgi:hypothetical protein